MKFTKIFASLMVLGLAAPVAFADAPATASASTQSQLDSMRAQLNKMEAIINQNNAGGFQQAADWTSRITISGLVNVDAYASNTSPNFGLKSGTAMGGHSSNLSVNNANLFVDALVNDWTNVHMGLAYNSNRSKAYSREPASPIFDEGYVTIANFSETPFFFRAGTEYLPYGFYDRYPMVQNPTQLLSETRATAAQVGFVSPVGVYGSVYGFRGMSETTDPVNRPRINNWGANLGYAFSNAMYGLKLDAGYLNNMADVNYIGHHLASQSGTYSDRVGGLALHAGGSMGPFDAKADWVTALQRFNAANVGYNGKGAKPSAWGAEIGYTFPVLAHQSRVGVGYQQSYQSSSKNTYTAPLASIDGVAVTSNNSLGAYGLPKNRYYGTYTVNVSKWTDIGLEVYHDRDFSLGQGGTGTSATVGVLQLGVKFA